jgi:hypothetical protein
MKAHWSLVLALCAARFALIARDGPSFPLKASADGRYLVDAAGKPFFYHGDTAWQITKKLTREEAEVYLDDRTARGFTAIQVQAFSREAGPITNRYGHEPFSPPDDILKPNEAYWKHVDFVLEAAEQRGFFVAFAPLWLRWGGADQEGWRYHLTDANAAAFGRWIAQRYRHHKNLMWILVGDANPIDRSHAVAEMARAIKKIAPHQMITAHNRPTFASSAFFDTQDWLDVNMAYTYEEIYPHVLGEWNRVGRPRPMILGESGYEHESNDGRGGAPLRMRKQACQTILAGGLGGHCYGHEQLWRFGERWREALNDPGSRQMAQVKALFSSLPWWKLVPDQNHEFAVSGREIFGKQEYVMTARARDGSFGLSYFPTNRLVTYDLSKLTGRVTATWYDPTDGSRKPVDGSPFPTAGRRDFTPSGNNASGDSDWVLLLEVKR